MLKFHQLFEKVKELYPIDVLLEASNDFDPVRQQRGQKAENDFAMAMYNHGYYMKEADRKEEREYHIDFLMFDDKDRTIPSWTDRPENSGVEHPNTVEIKQKNKIIDDNILVEFVAKDQYAGWLCSHANYVAYEMGEGQEQKFVFVKTENLRGYVNSLILKRGLDEFPLFKQGLDPNKSTGASIFNSLNKYKQERKIEFVNHFAKAIFPKVYYRKEIRNDKGETRADGSVITFVPLAGVLAEKNTDLFFYTSNAKVNPEFKISKPLTSPEIMKELIKVVSSSYGSDDNESKGYIIDKLKSNDISKLIDELGDSLKNKKTLNPENINKLSQFYKQNPNHITFK